MPLSDSFSKIGKIWKGLGFEEGIVTDQAGTKGHKAVLGRGLYSDLNNIKRLVRALKIKLSSTRWIQHDLPSFLHILVLPTTTTSTSALPTTCQPILVHNIYLSHSTVPQAAPCLMPFLSRAQSATLMALAITRTHI